MAEGVFDRVLDVNNTNPKDYRVSGDFNGDGKTDLAIFKYSNNEANSTIIKNYSGLKVFTLTEENNSRFYKIIHSVNFSFSKISSISVADIDLDGDDDFILQQTHVWFNEVCNEIKHYQSHEFKYHGLISSGTGNLNFSLKADVFPSRSYNENGYFNFKYENIHDIFYIQPIIADFDGDGMMDLVERVTRTEDEPANNHWHGITQIPYRKVDPNVQHERMQAYLSTRRHLPNILDRYVGYGFPNQLAQYIPMDFNGNGKLDLMCTYKNNSSTEILEFNNTTNALQIIYNLGFPTQFHKDLKTGDFNGDGNTDLLYYVNNTWMIGYSTGNGGLGFEEHDATSNWFSHNFNVGNGAIRVNFSIADLNGDGKSDIVERLVVNGQANTSSIHAYFSTGNGFVKEFCGANHLENGLPISFEHIYSGDFNGDGKQDFSVLGDGTSFGLNVPFINEQFNQFKASLKKIHVGSKHNYEFKWGTLPNSQHFKKTALNGPGNPLVLHARNIVPPLTILEELTITSGNRETIQKYFYNNLLYHLHGRGLMGFYNTAIINWNPSLEKRTTIVSEFRQNSEFAHLLNLKTTTTYRKGTLDNAGFVIGQHELSKSIYQYTQIRTTPLNKSIYFVYPNIITAYDYINDFVKETCFKYDRFGNLTLQKTSDFYLIEYPNITYYQSSVSMAYHKKGFSWIPGSCVKKENVAIKTGLSGHFYNKEIFDYNSKGNLSYNQVFQNNSQYELITTLQYDTYGNLIHKTVSDAQPQIKTEQITFANQGRFPQTHTNVLGQIKTTTWDSKLGTIESETDYAGTVSTYTYNEWGDILSESRDGLTTFYNKSYTNLYNAFIKKEVIDPFGLVSSAYFDCSGNKIRTESVGFNGIGQVQEYEFNQDNQLMAQSNVYDLGNVSATKRLTEYTYDFLNRVTVVKYHGINQLYKSYNKNKVTEIPLKGLTNTASNISERTLDPIGNTIKISDVGGEINYQFGHHNKLIATTSNGSTISIEYNAQLNKSKLIDPNAGIMEYKYNAWGELIEQTDAKANKFTYSYDIAGRLLTKTSLSGDEYVYSYYPTPPSAHGEINQLQKESLLKNGILVHEKEFSYFPDGLVKDIKELGANNNTYTSLFEYDSYKRLITAHYPNISLAYAYNNFNDIISITDANSNQLLWQQNEVAVDDRNIKTTYGNGYINQYNYDTYLQLAGITSIKAGSPNVVALDQQYNFELGSNNLLSRVTAGVGSESFTYDNLNRLTGITEIVGSNTKNKVYNYAANGNILSSTNSGAQTLDYTSSKPHAIIDHQFTLNQGVPSTSAEEHTYTYNDFNSITQITQTVLNTPTSHRTIDIAYGVDQQRIKMEYSSPTSAYASTTYYIGSSNMEIRGTAEFTYLYDPSGAPFAIHKKTGETGEIYYLHLDHLGSIVDISDEQGGIVEKRSYDAWGRHRHPNTWDYLVMNPFGMGGANDITLRGYTFHEHLPHFSLINMNGRLYDYVLGRMLSPDNFVQSPDNTQSFNRYSYCWNNPLKYTDPSGEIVFAAVVGIAAIVGGGINLATNWKNVNSFGDGLYYFGVGAAVGAGAVVGGAALAPVIGTGAIAGAALGAGSGFVTGFANTTYSTGGDWKAGLRDGGMGAVYGGVGGAVIGGAIAGFRGNNIWTGNVKTSGLSAFSFKDIANGKSSPSWNFRDAYKINNKEFWKYGRIRELSILPDGPSTVEFPSGNQYDGNGNLIKGNATSLDLYYPSNDGFDDAGSALIELNKGEILGRYGGNKGSYFTNPKTPEAFLNLPGGANGRTYNEYIVNKTFTVRYGGIRGGLGNSKQYLSENSVEWLLKYKYLIKR